MGIKNFRIVLDSPTGAYFAGSNVTGRVLLTLDKQKKITGLRIKFKGYAHVSWKKTEINKRPDSEDGEPDEFPERKTVSYSAHEEFFSNKYYLLGNKNGDMVIKAGHHVYPFNTTLPQKIPTSFEANEGHVRYEVKATLENPWNTDDHFNQFFQVITPLDLNLIPAAKEPVKREIQKNFCCCWCKSGPLTLVVCMPHRGVVPGQKIPFIIEVDNASDVNVEAVNINIKQVTRFIVLSPKKDIKTYTKEIASKILEAVAPNSSKTFNDIIIFPKKSFTNLDACSIINVDFTLEVVACAEGGCKVNLSQEIPLIVGTIPVENSQVGNCSPFFGMIGGDFNTSQGSRVDDLAPLIRF